MSPQSSSPPASPPATSRWTGVVITLLVTFCITLIGLSGYVKYELDRAENVLAAPEQQATPDQQAIDKIRRILGYSGFLGMAQNFASSHDTAMLPDMRALVKQANDNLEHLPEKVSSETRHDLQAIIATFGNVLAKAEHSTASNVPAGAYGDFSAQDLLPLYAALPVLDARITSAMAADRIALQDRSQFWATCLTLICWAGLIMAACMAAAIFILLRGRNSAPMRALAQSVKNMARGDMRTAIWGMERQDAIGELARAIDMARFHFSQLPDMSLLSEQGPVRIRFEGNTRSLFEAMMRVISRDSEQVHAQASGLTEAVTKQQEALAHLVNRVEAVLSNVEKRAVSGDQQVRQALQGMLGSAEHLKKAQEHAADQLNRILPFLQERTNNLSEITQITGKQISQALQSLMLTERGLKNTAESSEDAIKKIAATADTLGERLFGAINLLQASGKVLAETTDTVKAQFDTAVERMNGAILPQAPASADTGAEAMGPIAQKLDDVANNLLSAHTRLETVLNEQTETARAHIELLTTQSGGLLSQATTTSQTLSSAADRLRDEQGRLAELIEKLGAMEFAAPQPLPPVNIDTQAFEGAVKDGVSLLERQLSALHGQIAEVVSKLNEPQAKEDPNAALLEQMREHWFQMAGQIEASRSNLAQVIAQQTDRVEAQIAAMAKAPAAAESSDFARDAQSQMEQQTLILNELVATLGLLDAHMQAIRQQVAKRA